MPVHKLLHHVQHIRDLKPVSITLGVDNRCNINCSFCFVKHRRHNVLMPAQKVPRVLDLFPTIKSVELGLGEPTMHPQFARIVDIVINRGVRLGMGTNGTLLQNYDKDVWNKFTWLSIGITHYIDEDKPIPDFNWLPCRHSYIMILHEKTPEAWKTRLKEFQKINKEKVLIRTDMYADWPTRGRFFREYPTANRYRERFKKFNGTCWLACLKPMVYPDGKVYPCCSGDRRDYYKEYKLGDCFSGMPLELQPLQVQCPRCSRTDELEIIQAFKSDEDTEFI